MTARHAGFTLMLLAAFGCGVPQPPAPAATSTPTPADHRDLLAAREAVWRAWFDGDSARLVELLPERMIGMEEDRAQIIGASQEFRRNGGRFESITFTDDEIVVRDGIAVTYARYAVRMMKAGKPDSMSGMAIELFVKENGRWINPSWHLHQEKR